MKNIKIIVATHKKYEMPEDNMYIPVQVGKEGKQDLEYTPDNTGENISLKNPYYCELTGLYWAWKNLDAEYIGLVHYRRYFSNKTILTKDIKQRLTKISSINEIDRMLESTDIILPKKRKYYIEDLYSHYKHTMYVEPLDRTKEIIDKKYPEYSKEFEKLHKRTSAHMFNMFIMRREVFQDYYKWFFAVLSEVERNIDMSSCIHPNRKSIIGYVAEFLLDIYLEANHLSYKEIDTVFLEKQNELKKVFKFFIRKLR